MNPVPFILLAISLPLLLGGCGEKESGAEVKTAEEKQQEVKGEVKPEETVAETKPKTEGVNENELEYREGIVYLKGSDTPYTGKVYSLYENGQKYSEDNYKDGKEDGLQEGWHENGRKWSEENWKDGKEDGLFASWHENGQKRAEGNWKDGNQDGLFVWWHENGQKKLEVNWKDGEEVEGSRKYWNSKGEPVDSGG